MLQIIYFSECVAKMNEADIHALQRVAVKNNSQHGITGILSIVNGHFVQVLEGPREPLRKTFERIRKDSRHENIRIVSERVIVQREFPKWDMGFSPCAFSQDLQDAHHIISQYFQLDQLSQVQSESLALLLRQLAYTPEMFEFQNT